MSRKEFSNYLDVVKSKNKVEVMKLWKNKFLSMTRSYGETLLHTVARCDATDLVPLFLQKGFKVDVTDKFGMTPLHIAADNKYDKLAEVLVSNGANINLGDNNGQTPLHIAACNNCDKVAEILVRNGANMNLVTKWDGWSPLHFAVCNNSDKVAEILVMNGANVNLADKKGETPLQIAQRLNNEECIFILTQLLIVNTDNVDAFQQKNGNNGLRLNKKLINLINQVKPQKIINYIRSLNISEEEISEAKLLLQNVPLFKEINLYRSIRKTHCKMFEDSVSVDLINGDTLLGDKCALQLAVDADSIIMVNEVLKLIHEFNDVLERKLEICKENSSTMYNILQNRKATLKQLYKKGYSRLDVAVADGSVKMLEYLLEKENYTEVVISKALSIAMDYNNVECVQILTKYRADYNYTNNMKQTLLHSAVENRNTEIYNALVDKCTNFEKLDYLGLTALQRAVMYKDESFIKEILRKDECWNRRVHFTKPMEYLILDEEVDNINICYELWRKQFPHLIDQLTTKETTLSLSVKAYSDKLEIFSNYLTQQDVEFQDGMSNTILHSAVNDSNKEMCYRIIRISNKTLGLHNFENLSPLRLAVRKAMEIECKKVVAALDTVDCLIKLGATLEQNEPDKQLSVLQEAVIKTENEELLIRLLQTNETITALTEKEFYILIEQQFYNSIPLLVKKFQKETVSKCLSKNAVIDLFEREKYCLLMSIFRYLDDSVKSATFNEYLYASYEEHNENFFSYLSETQNIEAKLINDKETIMTLLIKNDDKIYFSYLIQGKSAWQLINYKNSTMNLPIHLVVSKKWYNMTLLVIKYTENLDEENGDGFTPLAILINQLGSNVNNIVELGELLPLIYTLIDKKCSIYRISHISGRSPISYAGKYRFKIESYHEKHGSEVLGGSPGAAVDDITTITKQETEFYNCFICDNRIVDRLLDCGHTFCRVCIENLDRCPNCRETIINPRKMFL